MNNIGIVIEIDGNSAIIMTDECTFERIKKKKDMYPGKKILIDSKDIISPGKNHIKYYSTILAGIAAAVFLMVFSYFRFFYAGNTYAYIDVDINPSFGIAIDGKEKVRDIIPINEDAKDIIGKFEFEGMNIKEALKEIIDISREQGYINNESSNNFILISAALDKSLKNPEKKNMEDEKLEDMIKGIQTDLKVLYGKNIDAHIVKVPSDYKSKSRQNDISMGKYYIFEKLNDMGKTISIQDLKSDDIYEILKDNNIDLFNVGKSPGPTVSITQTPIPASTVTFAAIPTPLSEIAPTSTPSIRPTEAPIVIKSHLPANTPVNDSNGSGLRGEYYGNIDFTLLKLVRIDPVIDFDWGESSPDNSINNDSYSIRWTGKIEPLYTETYTFYTNTDDGARLWVDNVLIIDEWKSQSATEYSGTINLAAGKKYDIKMEYYEHRRSASAKLMWSSKSQTKEIIPKSQLYPSDTALPPEPANGLNAEYFNDMELKNLIFTRIDCAIDFNWMKQPPVSPVNDEKFSIRWTGKIQARYSEEYTFYTLVDDGVRLWVDDVLIIDNWTQQKSEMEWCGKIKLDAYRQYNIKIEYFNSYGPASMKLMWSSNRQEKQTIPCKNLFTN